MQKKSLLICSLTLALALCPSFMPSMATKAHAQVIQWGEEALGTGNLTVTNSVTAPGGTNVSNVTSGIITLGGAKLGTVGPHTVVDSKLTIKDNSTVKQASLSGHSITLYGGYASGLGAGHTVTNNLISIENSKIWVSIADNSILMYGGRAEGASAHRLTGNRIDIREGELTGNGNAYLYGGQASGDGTGHKLTDNSINIEGGTHKFGSAFNLYGGYANGTGGHELTGNAVTIKTNDTSSFGSVSLFGGHAEGAGDGHKLTDNEVAFEGDLKSEEVIKFYGGSATGNGSHTVTGNKATIAKNSTLKVTTASVNGNDIQLFGGRASGDGTGHTLTGNLIAFEGGNTLEVAGTNGNIEIYGGYGTGSGIHKVTGNTVALIGKIDVSTSGNVILAGGGGKTVGNTGDWRSGNTLRLHRANVDLKKDVTGTSTVENFQHYDFKPSFEHIINTPNTPC